MKKMFTLQEFIAKNKEIAHYENKFAILDLSKASIIKTQYHQLEQPIEVCGILMVTTGEVNITVDNVPHCLKKNRILILAGQRIINDFYASERCEGHCLIFDNDYLDMLVHEERPPRELMPNLWLTPMVELEEDEFAILWDVVRWISFNLHCHPKHPFLSGILKNELRIFNYELWNALLQNRTIKTQTITPYEKTASEFVRLLQKNFRAKHELAYYASTLCVSTVFLTRAMEKATKKTARQWIDEMLVVEAKILLRKPGCSIKEIAEKLHFSDQSSFSKFFKKNTGRSPSEYGKK
jgi:AraC-like DNA-binding protein